MFIYSLEARHKYDYNTVYFATLLKHHSQKFSVFFFLLLLLLSHRSHGSIRLPTETPHCFYLNIVLPTIASFHWHFGMGQRVGLLSIAWFLVFTLYFLLVWLFWTISVSRAFAKLFILFFSPVLLVVIVSSSLALRLSVTLHFSDSRFGLANAFIQCQIDNDAHLILLLIIIISICICFPYTTVLCTMNIWLRNVQFSIWISLSVFPFTLLSLSSNLCILFPPPDMPMTRQITWRDQFARRRSNALICVWR